MSLHFIPFHDSHFVYLRVHDLLARVTDVIFDVDSRGIVEVGMKDHVFTTVLLYALRAIPQVVRFRWARPRANSPCPSTGVTTVFTTY